MCGAGEIALLDQDVRNFAMRDGERALAVRALARPGEFQKFFIIGERFGKFAFIAQNIADAFVGAWKFIFPWLAFRAGGHMFSKVKGFLELKFSRGEIASGTLVVGAVLQCMDEVGKPIGARGITFFKAFRQEMAMGNFEFGVGSAGSFGELAEKIEIVPKDVEELHAGVCASGSFVLRGNVLEGVQRAGEKIVCQHALGSHGAFRQKLFFDDLACGIDDPQGEAVLVSGFFADFHAFIPFPNYGHGGEQKKRGEAGEQAHRAAFLRAFFAVQLLPRGSGIETKKKLLEVFDHFAAEVGASWVAQNFCAAMREREPEWFRRGKVVAKRGWKQMIANFLPVAGDFLNLRVCRVCRGSVFFGVRDVLGDIRDEDDYLAASRAAEPVLGFGFHAAAVGRFRRREHNEMNGAIEPRKQFGIQTGAGGKARQIAKDRFCADLVPWAEETLNDGLHYGSDLFVAGPAIREEAVVARGGIHPEERTQPSRNQTPPAFRGRHVHGGNIGGFGQAHGDRAEMPLYRIEDGKRALKVDGGRRLAGVAPGGFLTQSSQRARRTPRRSQGLELMCEKTFSKFAE